MSDENEKTTLLEPDINRDATQLLSAVGLKSGDSSGGSTSPAQILEGQVGLKYDVGEQFASGGMGVILRAKDVNLRRVVAMKVLQTPLADNDNVLRFIGEAQVTGQLEHPGIVPVHDLGVDAKGNVFYTMKLVKGVTLNAILNGIRKGDRNAISHHPLSHLLSMFLKICDAMAFAHTRKVIHRDLKPENIMVGEFGETLVMDWGIAKILEGQDGGGGESPFPPGPAAGKIEPACAVDAESAGFRTMEGKVLGTLAYMSPEQAMNKRDEVDERSDIYSLGAILYEILVLRPPVDGLDFDVVYSKVVNGLIAPPTTGGTGKRGVKQKPLPHLPSGRAPDALSAVAMKALSLRCEERYQSVKELQKDIEAYQGGFATAAEEAGVLKQLWLLMIRHKGFVAAAAIVALAVASGLVVSLAQWRKAVAAEARAVLDERRAVDNERRAVLNEKRTLDALAQIREMSVKAAPKFLFEAQRSLDALDRAKALETVSTAVGLDPGLADAWLLKGRIHLGDVQFDEAREALLKGGAKGTLLAGIAEKFGGMAKMQSGGLDERTKALLADELSKLGENGIAAHLRRNGDYDSAIDVRLKRAKEAFERGLPENSEFYFGYKLLDDKTISVTMVSSHAASLAPLKGLPVSEVRFIKCGTMADLPILSSMPLKKLSWVNAPHLSEISFLRDVPLEELDISWSAVSDLSPLSNAPLKRLNVEGCVNLVSIEPLKGAPLTWLHLGGTKVADISPLRGMPLDELDLTGCGVTDVSPLSRTPLRSLKLEGDEKISDISPLRGMGLSSLGLVYANVTDYSALQELPLKELALGGVRLTDISFLAGMRLESLTLANSPGLTDLSPLAGLPLRSLTVTGCYNLQDRSIISSLSTLEELWLCHDNFLADISFLSGLNLKKLYLHENLKLTDITVVGTLKTLEELSLPQRAKDIEFLRKLPNVMKIGYEDHPGRLLPADEFWRAYDAAKAGK